MNLTKKNWNELANKIRERDDFTCAKCSWKQKTIAVHHIIPYKVSKNNSPDNLICLCPKHHLQADNDYKNLGRTAYLEKMLKLARDKNV